MTRLWISIILLASTIGLCGYELYSIRKITEQSEEAISVMREYVSSGDMESALQVSKQLNALWEDKNTLLAIFIQHEPLENIEQTLALIETTVSESDISDFRIESARAVIQISKLSDTDLPTVGNIL